MARPASRNSSRSASASEALKNIGTRASDTSNPQAEVDEEIRHIRDLVVIRTLLSTRGATAAQLREYDAAIDDARRRLAETAQRTAPR